LFKPLYTFVIRRVRKTTQLQLIKRDTELYYMYYKSGSIPYIFIAFSNH